MFSPHRLRFYFMHFQQRHDQPITVAKCEMNSTATELPYWLEASKQSTKTSEYEEYIKRSFTFNS